MEITVNGCHNCVFRHTEYDDFAIGDSFLDVCVLAMHSNQVSYVISSKPHSVENIELPQPDWCMLKNNPITITLK